ncbi:hypothetical protein EDB89DRAFT_1904393 [Lactarius sanguifluus]|nr:hypothetical protein EDB89DRAFT_1904393 [Lactarius sanguifluus]
MLKGRGGWGLGVCWVGVAVSWWVVGSCAPCRDGMGVGGGWAWRAALRRHGGSAGSWRAVLGRRGGLAVAGWRGRMEVARVHEWAAISRVLCRVGAARWVGGGGVSEQDGGGSCARMAVLHAMLGWRVGSGGVLRAMSGWRVGEGTNGSGSHARGGSNGLQCSG